MTFGRHNFPKEERLSWKRHIDYLFENGKSFIAYPLRVVYVVLESNQLPVPTAILVSVSKKRFKRAVKRNRVKRQVREAYRTRKDNLLQTLDAKGKSLLVAFLYLENELRPTSTIGKSMEKALRVLSDKVE